MRTGLWARPQLAEYTMRLLRQRYVKDPGIILRNA